MNKQNFTLKISSYLPEDFFGNEYFQENKIRFESLEEATETKQLLLSLFSKDFVPNDKDCYFVRINSDLDQEIQIRSENESCAKSAFLYYYDQLKDIVYKTILNNSYFCNKMKEKINNKEDIFSWFFELVRVSLGEDVGNEHGYTIPFSRVINYIEVESI